MQVSYWTCVSTLLALGLGFLVARWLLQLVGRAVGCYLRRRASARRQSIFAQVKLDEESYRSQEQFSEKSDDGDWEKVESYAAGTATNGGEAADEWVGVIGFLHPFW